MTTEELKLDETAELVLTPRQLAEVIRLVRLLGRSNNLLRQSIEYESCGSNASARAKGSEADDLFKQFAGEFAAADHEVCIAVESQFPLFVYIQSDLVNLQQ